ncbi:MAG: Gfo/Idh/MocA family oxidoreductase [Chloroflexi bacterium]|nr:Gfo/Idh/MocA family oxidoreductase [Chloroflexota bacterium]
MSPKRLGLVGFGLIWDQMHKEIVLGMPDVFQVSALSASSDRSAAKAAAQYPSLPFTKDYRELIAHPDVDMVFVQTPIPMTVPVVIEALRAGKDVITEKPLGGNCEDASSVVRAVRETKRKLYVLENSYYQPRWGEIAAIVNSGAIGTPVQYEQTAHMPVDPIVNTAANYGTTPWRITPGYALGFLLDAGIHQMCALSKVFGHAHHVQAVSVKLRPEYGDIDQAVVLFEHERELHGIFSHSCMLGPQRNYFFIRGTKGLIEVAHDEAIILGDDGSEKRVVLDPSAGYREMWAAVGAAVTRGEEAAYTAELAAMDVCLVDAVGRALAAKARTAVTPGF